MAGGMNLASKYMKYFEDFFYKEAQITLVLKNRAEYKGAHTFVIATPSYAPLNDYVRSGTQRYGVPNDLSRNLQTCIVTQDKGFSFIIDRGDWEQSQYIMEAGKLLKREEQLVVTPQVDKHCFGVLSSAAINAGATASTAITTSNAYEMFLNGMQYQSDRDVPENGRVAYCTPAFVNFVKRDPAFMRYGNLSQEMINKGVIGEVDGCKIVKCNRLPYGASFLIVHPASASLAFQLEDYKLHDNPPGVSGWLCEGRVLYDCFTHDNTIDGIYVHMGYAGLGYLSTLSVASRPDKSTFIMNCDKSAAANKWYVITATDRASLPALTYGTPIDVTTSSSPWYGARELRSKETELTIDAGQTVYKIAEVDASMNPIAYAEGKLYVG